MMLRSFGLVCYSSFLMVSCRGGGMVADADSSIIGGSCTSGSVTIGLDSASGSGWFFSEARPACWRKATNWLRLFDSSQNELYLIRPCLNDCDRCSAVGVCSQLCCSIPIATKNESLTWDGTYWVPGSCGSTSTECVRRECAPPGRYTARLCAFPEPAAGSALPDCATSAAQTCIDLPFDYPSTTPVTMTLP